MKKVLAGVLSLVMTFSLTAWAGTTSAKAATSKASSMAERQKVNFWYLWGGDEAKIIEKIIKAYNASQSKYEVVGLSTPDTQKIITAISGGQGPDVTDNFGGAVAQYAEQNIAMPLDSLISANKFDTSVYVPSALQHQKYKGKIYALPLSINVEALFYNKTLLKAAGITQPPKTLEELISMSNKTTIVKNGKMTQLGGPFVASYWSRSFAYAYGYKFGSADGATLTPDNPGFKKTLEYAASQVTKFGKNALNNFITSGSAKRYTPQDPFLQGTEAFRIDGPWFYKMAKDAKVNFGVIPLPGAAKVGGRGYSILDTSMMFIPTTAKCKDGAFDFMKYITAGEGSRIFVTEKGDLPSTTKLVKDPKITSLSPSFKVFLDVVAQNHSYLTPQFNSSTQYDQAIDEAVNSVMLGAKVDDALSKLKKTTNSLEK